MTTKTLYYTTTLTVTCCGNCGIPFAIPDNLYAARVDDGKNFYCPNGHFIGWSAANETARLRREANKAEERATRIQADLDRTEASRRAWKGQTTRLRNRASEGECVYCGKFFVGLAVHTAKAHPQEHPRELDEGDAGTQP